MITALVLLALAVTANCSSFYGSMDLGVQCDAVSCIVDLTHVTNIQTVQFAEFKMISDDGLVKSFVQYHLLTAKKIASTIGEPITTDSLGKVRSPPLPKTPGAHFVAVTLSGASQSLFVKELPPMLPV